MCSPAIDIARKKIKKIKSFSEMKEFCNKCPLSSHSHSSENKTSGDNNNEYSKTFD